jgi:hypothetical protein
MKEGLLVFAIVAALYLFQEWVLYKLQNPD